MARVRDKKLLSGSSVGWLRCFRKSNLAFGLNTAASHRGGCDGCCAVDVGHIHDCLRTAAGDRWYADGGVTGSNSDNKCDCFGHIRSESFWLMMGE